MSNTTKAILGIAGFALLIVLSYFAYKALTEKIAPEGGIGVTEDKADVQGGTGQESEKTLAPDFTVLDSEGNEVKLSELIGKPMVLNFWASWCSPCKSEMPEFNKVYEELKDEINFVMVDMVDGQRETMEKGKKFVEEEGFSFPTYYDTKSDAAYTYGIRSIPTTFFIDKDGYIVTGARGAIDEKTLRKGIEMIK